LTGLYKKLSMFHPEVQAHILQKIEKHKLNNFNFDLEDSDMLLIRDSGFDKYMGS